MEARRVGDFVRCARRKLTLQASLVVMLACCSAFAQQSAAQTYAEHIYTGFGWEMFGTYVPGDTSRLFVATIKLGQIDVLNLNSRTVEPQPFLDLSHDLTIAGNEQGLLGLAFDPNYATNGYFYVNFTMPDNSLEVRRYEVLGDPATSNIANPESGHTILNIPKPYNWHNGGWIGFSPKDGDLYMGVGDPGGDEGGNAQIITNNLFGKILRIDVHADDFPDDFNRNYAIPASNPFVGKEGDDEIWAYGLRNPWRASFDSQTGDLWINDTGEATKEEVDYQPANSPGGVNYGWSYREGTVEGPPGHGLPPSPLYTDPVYDYDHHDPDPLVKGIAITASQFYRGPVAAFQGDYFFADFGSKNIWKLDPDAVDMRASVVNVNSLLVPDSGTVKRISSFGEDAAGNLYLMDFDAPGEAGTWRISTSSKDATWNGDSATAGEAGDGASWIDSNNWTRETDIDTGALDQDRVIFAAGSTQSVVNLDADHTVSAVVFSAPYTLTGHTLKVQSGNITVDTGVTATIRSNLFAESVNHSIRKLGPGTLLVEGAAGQIAVKEGTLGGNGTLEHLTIRAGATVAPGDLAGKITVNQSFTMYEGSKLAIDIGGDNNSDLENLQFDYLMIGGAAKLAGTLSLDLVDLGSGVYTPVNGDAFTILSASGGISGTFDSLDLPELTAGLLWKIISNATTFSLEVVPRYPGDYTGNGRVLAGDYIIWRKSLGLTGDTLAADGSGPSGVPDGVVDDYDYLYWRAHFGNTEVGLGSLVGQVPEPASAILLSTLGSLCFCGLRRRRVALSV